VKGEKMNTNQSLSLTLMVIGLCGLAIVFSVQSKLNPLAIDTPLATEIPNGPYDANILFNISDPCYVFKSDTSWDANLFEPIDYNSLTFCFDKGEIEINIKTGKVTISEGLSLDEAAREFWQAVESMYPHDK
jgi:hypothetical protein